MMAAYLNIVLETPAHPRPRSPDGCTVTFLSANIPTNSMARVHQGRRPQSTGACCASAIAGNVAKTKLTR
jgi:hypothetical protein